MPLLDVTSVLTSPMFADNFQVTRRVDAVGTNGRNTVTASTSTQSGVVQPDGDNTDERPETYGTGRKTISVITKFRLQAQVNGCLPDLVTWRGDTYLVETIEDLTNYGAGFIEATCTSQDGQNAAPGTPNA